MRTRPGKTKSWRHYLWRAVDQDDNVLDILVQKRRNKQAAKKFCRQLLKGLRYVPRVIITDKLKSYGAAERDGGTRHHQHAGRRSVHGVLLPISQALWILTPPSTAQVCPVT